MFGSEHFPNNQQPTTSYKLIFEHSDEIGLIKLQIDGRFSYLLRARQALALTIHSESKETGQISPEPREVCLGS